MKRFSFLPNLKLAALVVILLTAILALFISPNSQAGPSVPSFQVHDNHNILHVGKGQPASAAYQQLNENGKITIYIQEDQASLQLKYNLPDTHSITLRLYDQSGSLQHIEKLMNLYVGMERTLDLAHLMEGTYYLQLSTEKGMAISQEISLHTHKQM